MTGSRAIVIFVFLAAVLDCSKTDYLGWMDGGRAAGGKSDSSVDREPPSTGGVQGSGGSATGGTDIIIGTSGPDGGSGAGGSAGTGGSTSDAGLTPAELCTTTAGTVASGSCCSSVSEFPDTCLIGACSCAPTNSRMVNTCACKSGACFDRTLGCRPYGDAGP